MTLPPFVRTSATSREAAIAMLPHRGTAQERVLAAIRDHGPCTDETVARVTGLNPSSARPRRVELAAAGLIVEAGSALTQSGRRATCWRVKPAGPEQGALGL